MHSIWSSFSSEKFFLNLFDNIEINVFANGIYLKMLLPYCNGLGLHMPNIRKINTLV